MISIYSSGLAPKLEAKLNVPILTKDEAEVFVEALIKATATAAISDSYMWKRYRMNEDGTRRYGYGDGGVFWEEMSDDFRTSCIRKAGDAIYSELISLTGANPNVLKGAAAISFPVIRDAVRDAIDIERQMYKTGIVPEPAKTPENTDNPPGGGRGLGRGPGYGLGVQAAMSSALPTYQRAVTMTMRKALGVEAELTNFVPNDAVALELYRRKGVVPKGYLDRNQIDLLSPAYAAQLEKAKVPMLRQDYFEEDVAQRTADDMVKSREAWAAFFAGFVPVDDTALEKGQTSEVSLADRLGGFSDAKPQALLKALAYAFFDLVPAERHKIVKGFSGDPAAVVASLALVTLEDQPGLYRGELSKARLRGDVVASK